MKIIIKTSTVFLILAIVFSGFSVLAFTEAPYDTYTYAYDGTALISPAAYFPLEKITHFGEFGTLNVPASIITDKEGNILVADKGNNRIVILDSSFANKAIISSFINDGGENDALDKPEGVFVDSNGFVYVADTGNGRIVVFDKDYKYIRTVAAPIADILPDDFIYQPRSVAVDNMGSIYVVSANTNMGVLAMSEDGTFEGFLGAQRVTINPLELLWRMFMSKAQIDRSESFIPCTFSSLTIDETGMFIYVTSTSIDRYDLYKARRSKDGSYAPIKKLNPSGNDVLMRTGFFPPIGDVNFNPYGKGKNKTGPSSFRSVCLAQNESYFIADDEYSKIFYYDSYGNLLYAFGGKGMATGLFTKLCSVAVLGDKLLALDETESTITVFGKTEYGAALDKAIGYQADQEFDLAIAEWENILSYNNNFDLSYHNIGKNLLEKGDYKQAMHYFKLIQNKEYYYKAFRFYRQEILKKINVWLFLGLGALIAIIIWLFKAINKYNEKWRNNSVKPTLTSQLIFSFYLLFHPIKGYWEIKEEKRGSTLSATILLGLALVSSVYGDIGSAFFLKDVDSSRSILFSIANLLVPFTLWCVSNWCFTSLMDGKGKMADIYIATSYALVPLVLTQIPLTLIGHLLVANEFGFVSFISGLSSFGIGLLIFFGSMVTHEYSFGKNVISCGLTIAGIFILMFLSVLFFNLLGQMGLFLTSIITEVSLR